MPLLPVVARFQETAMMSPVPHPSLMKMIEIFIAQDNFEF
jgi:hypothetical protein